MKIFFSLTLVLFIALAGCSNKRKTAYMMSPKNRAHLLCIKIEHPGLQGPCSSYVSEYSDEKMSMHPGGIRISEGVHKVEATCYTENFDRISNYIEMDFEGGVTYKVIYSREENMCAIEKA